MDLKMRRRVVQKSENNGKFANEKERQLQLLRYNI